jgi:DNA-binding MarR family transcriptional regulator
MHDKGLHGSGEHASDGATPDGAMPDGVMPNAAMIETFQVLSEISIIAQLSQAAFEAAMPGWLVSHFGVIQHLTRRGDAVTPLALARIFQVPKTTMTHTLKVLEERGLITMQPNPRDGRSKVVILQDAGRVWHGQAIRLVAARNSSLRARVPEGTLSGLLPGLVALRVAMDAMRDSGRKDQE